MTDLLHDIDAPSDAELISRVRGGDVAAYGELFSRHVDAAKRLSRQLVRGPDADDLVSDAFAKVLSVLQAGGGPDVAFRAYLLTAVRRLHVDRLRSGAKLQTSDDMEMFDPGVPFQDTAVEAFESGAAAKAFASLPERWQLVLWHLEVEGQKPADVAPLLGMSPNSVSALAYRAREGLRQAFLTMHLSDISETDCRWVNEHLGAYVRNGLAKRDSSKVQAHLDECRRCTAMYLELTEVNSNLRGIIAPLLLGAAAAGYLSSTGAAAGGGLGLMSLFDRARDAVTANSGVATAGAIAAGVAAVATAGILLLPSSGPENVVGADDPITALSPPGGSAGTDGPRDPGDRKTQDSAGDQATDEPTEALPSGLPSDTAGVSPSVAEQPSDGTQPTDGATDGGGGQEPGPGGPGPGGEPGPTEPGPTQPGPTEPGPTQPGPTEPGPTEPGPTEPGPTEPGPTEPGPTEPPPPPVITADVTVQGEAQLVGNSLSFTVSAGTELPPSLELSLTSDPAGITFGTGEGCEPGGDPLHVTCAVTTAAPSTSFLRTLAAAALPQVVTVPVVIPEGQPDTTLTVDIGVPAGYDDPNVGDNRTTAFYDAEEPTPVADLALAPLVETGHTVDANGTDTFTFTTRVSGVPAGTPSVSLLLAGARFGESGTPGCSVDADGTTLLCSDPAESFDLTFTVVTDSDASAVPVSLTLASLPGYDDPPGNNTQQATLHPVPETTLALGDLQPAAVEPDDAGLYTLTVPVTGIPAGVDEVTLLLMGDARVVGDRLPAGCRVDGAEGRTVTCSTGGASSLSPTLVLEATGAVPANVSWTVTVPDGYVDLDTSDNSSGATLLAPVVTSADVSLDLPSSVQADGALDYTVAGTVTGVPADYTGGATFTLSSPVAPDGGPRAELVPSMGCTVREGGQALDCPTIANGPFTFSIRVKDNSVPTDVAITMAPLDGLGDPVTGNNTGQVRLEAFRPSADASVDGSSEVRGNSGSGSVTATVGVEPTAPVTLHVAFDASVVQTTLPSTCVPSGAGATCEGVGAYSFGFVLADRSGNETREATFDFTVSVPDAYEDRNDANNARSVTVRRFGDEVAAGDAGALTPSAEPSGTSTPEAQETFRAAEETLAPVTDATGTDRDRDSRPDRKPGKGTAKQSGKGSGKAPHAPKPGKLVPSAPLTPAGADRGADKDADGRKSTPKPRNGKDAEPESPAAVVSKVVDAAEDLL